MSNSSSGIAIGFELTRHCNLHCTHCLRNDTATAEEIGLPLFKRILDEAKAYGHPWILLTGGEPTLHSEFFSVLDAIGERGYPCQLVTNGTTFTKMAARLRSHQDCLRTVTFSIDGAVEATHDAIRGRGTFRKAIFALALARHFGFRTALQFVANKTNWHEIDLLPKLAQELGAGILHVCHAQPSTGLYRAGQQLSPQEWREIEGTVKRLAETTDYVPPSMSVGRYAPGDIAPCQTLRHRVLNIDYRGRLTFCCQFSNAGCGSDDIVGDLNELSLSHAHLRFLKVLEQVVAERVAGFSDGTFGELDGYHCWHCQKRFGKLEWMRNYQNDPWVKGEHGLANQSTIK